MVKFLESIKKELEYINAQIEDIYIEPKDIRKEIHQLILGNSKRIRTLVTLLYLKALNISVSTKSLNVMMIGELVHNASLLHDDVLDSETTRRGEPTINSIYSPNVAILSGDYLLSVATEKLLEIDNREILSIFLTSIQKMCSAEIKQLFYRRKLESIEDYLKICEGKTAMLFIAVMNSCLTLENFHSKKAIDFAKNFGVFFQLQNDLLDTSVIADSKNSIYTAKDILGVEKMTVLMDNYRERVLENILSLNNNIYRDNLEDLVRELC